MQSLAPAHGARVTRVSQNALLVSKKQFAPWSPLARRPAQLDDWRSRISGAEVGGRGDVRRRQQQEQRWLKQHQRSRRDVRAAAAAAAAAAAGGGAVDGGDDDATPKPPPPSPTKNVTRELLSIAAPMLAALACDPIASLVDTALLGRLGAVQLAAAGAALSVFNTCAKVVNMPLLAATTSSVAQARGERERRDKEEEVERRRRGEDENVAAAAAAGDDSDGNNNNNSDGTDPRSAAATSAIAVALAVGLAQALALAVLGAGPAALAAWGVPSGSPLRPDAEAFLSWRALGAPATACLLVLQGVYRGLGDASPTFHAALAATALNVLLGYALIFGAGMGCAGAALATGIAQLLPAGWLASRLRRRHGVRPSWDASTLGALVALLGPAGWLVLRTVSVTGTYAAATALATRAGGAGGGGGGGAAAAAAAAGAASVAAAAAHQIAFGLWLAASLLSDALAVAAQSLLARSAASGDRASARAVVRRAVGMALALGLALGAAIAAASSPLARLFTSDPAVLALLDGTLMPVVAATQPVNALAFVMDGVLYGCGGFRFAALQMLGCALPAVAVMSLGAAGAAASAAAATPMAAAAARLGWVWAGLSLLMAGRAVSIALALALGRGPFRRLLWADDADDNGGGGGGGVKKEA